MISYEDECFQMVPSFGSSEHQYVTNSERDSTTYATLTPLRPLSPPFADKPLASSGASDSGLSSMASDNFDATSFLYGGTSASGDDMSSYDFLEPLMPIAMLDSSGNIQPCSPAPAPIPVMAKTLSLFDHVTLLSSSASTCSEYDSFGYAGASASSGRNDNVTSYFSASFFDCSTQSSSRASSPENNSDAFTSSGYRSMSQPPISVDSDDELDTRDIAEKVSNELRRYNISQVLFAQAVLGRSQGTLSDLLRNPKPWDKLKSGRETFARMQQWLQEPEKQRMAAFKRAGVKIDYVSPKQPEPFIAKPTNNSSSVHSRPGLSYANVAATTNDPNKQRSTVSEEQRQILLKIFNGNHHPDRDTQMGLAVELGLPVSIISNFFLNARRRLRYSYNRGGGNSNCIKRV